ncbi:MAG TPA: hypothetical protein VNO52_15295 [Methylomirabilota bacterium]|nr:hypothetical protein [Methylomirabilota bacterium]
MSKPVLGRGLGQLLSAPRPPSAPRSIGASPARLGALGPGVATLLRPGTQSAATRDPAGGDGAISHRLICLPRIVRFALLGADGVLCSMAWLMIAREEHPSILRLAAGLGVVLFGAWLAWLALMVSSPAPGPYSVRDVRITGRQ